MVLSFIYIVFFKPFRDTGQIKESNIYQINTVLYLLTLRPLVAPVGRSHRTQEFRAQLIIILQTKLCCRPDFPFKIRGNEREQEIREVDTRFHPVLCIVIIRITCLKSGNDFIRSTEFYHKSFRSAKKVPVLERDGSCRSQVTGRIGSLYLESY